LPEGASFCPRCGHAVNSPDADTPTPTHDTPYINDTANTDDTAADAPKTTEFPKKRKISVKKILLTVGISLLAAAIVWVIAFFAFSSIIRNLEIAPAYYMTGYVSDNGEAYIPYGDGDYIYLNGGVKEAYITPDKLHVVAIYEDNYICVMESEDIYQKTEIYAPSGDKKAYIIFFFPL
jgi:hypothetical protein